MVMRFLTILHNWISITQSKSITSDEYFKTCAMMEYKPTFFSLLNSLVPYLFLHPFLPIWLKV